MDPISTKNQLLQTPHTWTVLESIIAPDPGQREEGLSELSTIEGYEEQPLMVYVLTTRVLDPDLDVRFRAIKILGPLLGGSPGEKLPPNSFKTITEFTTHLDKSQLVKILEVAVRYLAAEEPIVHLLKLCSYAGSELGGILNDRKQSVEIRKQAIIFCGEVGFLSAVTAIQNLIQRINKNRNRVGQGLMRKKSLDEEELHAYAVVALAKLENF